MASIQLERGSISTVLDSELNSLANNQKVLSAEIDNSTALDIFDDLVLTTGTFGGAPSAGAICELWLLEALDGTNYADGSTSIVPASSDLGDRFGSATTLADCLDLSADIIPVIQYIFDIVEEDIVVFGAEEAVYGEFVIPI